MIGRFIVGGLIGGFIGALIWAAIGYAGFEIGWVAIGIGLLVGGGVRAASDGADGVVPGVVAVVIAIASIVVGKYATAYVLTEKFASETTFEFKAGPETMVAVMADELQEEYTKANRPVPPAPALGNPDAPLPQHYAPEIWTEAQRRWTALPPDQQTARTVKYEADMKELVGGLRGAVRGMAFRESFSPYDALWFILAALAAFRLGSGATSSD
jgi:hypothetical protein